MSARGGPDPAPGASGGPALDDGQTGTDGTNTMNEHEFPVNTVSASASVVGPIRDRSRSPVGGAADTAEASAVRKALVKQVSDLNEIEIDRSQPNAGFLADHRAMIDGFACMLPIKETKVAALARSVRAGGRPLVETFCQSITPFTTQNLRDMPLVEFGRTFEIGGCTLEVQAQLINCLESLLKEAIIRRINITEAVIASMAQLIWDNSLPRFGASLVGTYISIIFAREALLLFANTSLGAISLGNLSVTTLTVYSGYVYSSCSLKNLYYFLVYLGADPNNALLYIQTLKNYTTTQIQYIAMTLYLVGLGYISGNRSIGDDIKRLLAIFDRSPPPAAIGNPPTGAVADQAAAASALQDGVAGVARGGGVAVPLIGPLPQPGVGRVFIDSLKDIKDGFTFAFVRGFRFTLRTIENVFQFYAERGAEGQGVFASLNAYLQTVSNWGGEVIQAQARFVQPNNPNQEINKLISTLMGIHIDKTTTTVEFELGIYTFSENIKNEMLDILRSQLNHASVARVAREWLFLNQGCLGSLMERFGNRLSADGGLNIPRIQAFCQAMPLFSSGLTTELVAARSGASVPMSDSQQALAGFSSESKERMASVILSPDPKANAFLTTAKYVIESIGNMTNTGLTGMAIAVGAGGGPGVSPQVVLARMKEIAALETHSDIMAGASAYLRTQIGEGDGKITQEQYDQIISDLTGDVAEIHKDALYAYIVGQNPGNKIPQTVIEAVQAFLNKPIPSGLERFQTIIKTALISGINRYTAYLCDLTTRSATYVCSRGDMLRSVSGNMVAGFLRGCVNRIKGCVFVGGGVVAADAVPEAAAAAGNQAAAALNNADQNAVAGAMNGVIDNPVALVAVMAQDLENVAPSLVVSDSQVVVADDMGGSAAAPSLVSSDSLGDVVNDDMGGSGGAPGQGGGKSRSRKRSVAKRTRGKAAVKKQQSKKNKRQSRRKARRSSSRKSRK